MFGIQIPRNYYYGEGTDHVVKLTKAEADAANKIRLRHVRDDLYEVNLNRHGLRGIPRHQQRPPTRLISTDSNSYMGLEFF